MLLLVPSASGNKVGVLGSVNVDMTGIGVVHGLPRLSHDIDSLVRSAGTSGVLCL